MKNKIKRYIALILSIGLIEGNILNLNPAMSLKQSVLQNVNAADTLSVEIRAEETVLCNSVAAVYLDITGTVPSDAWVAFIPSDVPHTEKDSDAHDDDYCYLRDIKDGVAMLTAPGSAGNYDIRVFDGDDAGTAREVAYLPIVVTDKKTEPESRSAFENIEGEDYDESEGIENASGCVGFIDNGDYTVYNSIDFGTGAKSFYASCSAAYESGGVIEIRLDSKTGKKVGELTVPYTGNWYNFNDFSCNIEEVSGVHDLYLVYTGVDTNYLLDLDYFVFGKDEISDVTDVTLMGDVNEDGEFNATDIVALKKWLLIVPGTTLANWKNGDFTNDGKLNVIDLCMMKRALIHNTSIPEVIVSNFNINVVQNGPKTASTFTVSKDCTVYSILTYHWNNGRGKSLGQISLMEGSVSLGEWDASGTQGQNGAEDVNWWVYPEGIRLKAWHTYTVIDSDPDSWSCNSGSDFAGFYEITGIVS